MESDSLNPFKKTPWAGWGFILAVSAILYLVEWRNHGINMLDFEVYYRTALRMLHGENLYRIESDGFYIFKYSPGSALFFIPFTILPFYFAKNLYWIFLAISAVLSIRLSLAQASPGLEKSRPAAYNLLVVILLLSLGIHFYREFVLGQVNLLLYLSFLLVLIFYRSGRTIPAALAWSFGILFKPWGLIFIPYFIIKKDYRILAYFVLFSIVMLALPAIFYGFDGLVEQMSGWFNEINVEMGHKQALGAMANHTLFSVIYRYTPLVFLEMNGTMEVVYQLLILVILGFLVYLFIRKGTGVDKREVAEWALLMALMPLLAPANYNTFLLAGLALVILLVHFRTLPAWGKVLLVAGILLQGGNYNDLWGRELSDYFLGLSLISIGTVSFIVLLFMLRYRKIV